MFDVTYYSFSVLCSVLYFISMNTVIIEIYILYKIIVNCIVFYTEGDLIFVLNTFFILFACLFFNTEPPDSFILVANFFISDTLIFFINYFDYKEIKREPEYLPMYSLEDPNNYYIQQYNFGQQSNLECDVIVLN